MSRRSLLALLTAASLLATGCRAKETYKYRIAVIPKGLTHEHWQSVKRGADRAAADFKAAGLPVEILWDGPRTEGDSDEQINLIDQKARSGIHGLVLAPQNRTQMVPPIERVLAKKIPVVILDSDLDLQNELLVKYVATNNYNGGRMAAAQLLAAIESPTPRVILFRYEPGSESTEQREKGFLDHVKEQNDKGANITIVSEDKYAGSTVESAQKQARGLLGQYPDGKGVDGIFAVNESATSGMLNALREKKLHKKILLVGFDSSAPLLDAIREGDVVGLVVQDPYRMGYLSVWCVVRYLEGDDVTEGKRDLGTGEYFLTRENIDEPAMKERYNAEAQATRTLTPPTFHKR